MSRRRGLVWWVVALGVCMLGAAQIPAATWDREVTLGTPPGSAVAPVDEPAQVRISTTIEAAPFRITRAPPEHRYAPNVAASEQPAPVERPPWLLTGIIEARPRLAILEDQSGAGGRFIVSSGDEIADYLIAVVEADSVVVSSRGARWTYTLEAPWMP